MCCFFGGVSAGLGMRVSVIVGVCCGCRYRVWARSYGARGLCVRPSGELTAVGQGQLPLTNACPRSEERTRRAAKGEHQLVGSVLGNMKKYEQVWKRMNNHATHMETYENV